MMWFICILMVVQSVLTSPETLDALTAWQEFKLNHGKEYLPHAEEYRFNVFSENLKRIEEHNARYSAGLESFTKGINQFSDMTDAEWEESLRKSEYVPNYNISKQYFQVDSSLSIPDSIDYRDLGAVTPVKIQGPCGCCYAFSGIGALESHILLKKKKSIILSEQNIVDCTKKYGNNGCHGGSVKNTYDYIRYTGIMNAEDYPYEARENTCKFAAEKSVLQIGGYKHIPQGEKSLLAAIGSAGPAAASIDNKELRDYKSGIFEPKSAFKSYNHGVVIVGYGTEGGIDFWIIKNSHGSTWGEKGFARIKRNTKYSIGLENVAIYPYVD